MTPVAAARERILVIEDEPDIREVVEFNLRREGFRVSGAETAEEGLEKVQSEFPDAILLDIMLPGMSGLELCALLKSDPDLRAIPVIMVTAKDDAEDVIAGLEAGADDYISKPFSPRVLIARVKAVVRRGTWDAEQLRGDRLLADGVVIDSSSHRVTVEGQDVEVTATEFRLLHYLATNRGRVFTRNHLLTRVMGESATLVDRNIDVHVGAIRRKLGKSRSLLETVRGVGYRFRDSPSPSQS
ncbi:MAG: response regulator transcription factor [Planctomycetes bacterium]|nr:response regulator transcription factor [Planctomycetota bacterium]